ncbi:hypothetical protein L9F63_016265, partial [Diploptera punctata]
FLRFFQLFKACAPPLQTKSPDLYMKKPVMSCECDGHGWSAHMEKLRCLADKEKKLIHDITDLRKEMTKLNSSILECDCGDTETKLKSIYQADYVMKGAPSPFSCCQCGLFKPKIPKKVICEKPSSSKIKVVPCDKVRVSSSSERRQHCTKVYNT